MVPIPSGSINKVTIEGIRQKKAERQPITFLTAYDYPTARIVDEAGIDMILVGDTLAEVVLGYETTLPVTFEEMLHHTCAARRAIKNALLVADLPYGSYHAGQDQAVQYGVRFIKEAGAEAVKLEGGAKRIHVIQGLLDAEIPVMGHVGLTPQSVHRMGGYKVQARCDKEAEQLIRDALVLDRAGVFAIVLEGIPREVAAIITAEVSAATLGIGAGPDCDGQVLVLNDLLGLGFKTCPKFVRKYCDVGALIVNGVARFKADVESHRYPSDQESYHLPADVRSSLPEIVERSRKRR
jgi:3-methyl-2-oxobutanoate hydroxymethyltransferase